MPRTIGDRYRLDEELASGGFGTVWRAWDELLHVPVAVKQLRLDPTATDAERAKAVDRAQAEARSAAKLRDHPNVVAVHDVAFADGVPWLVMRLVRGHSLYSELAERGRLHPDDAGRIAIGVLEALAAAHDAGIVHRDVKPANIMLADDGTVLLTDFGIAKNDDNTKSTTRGILFGSLPYMSPERLDSENPPASDLFALGVCLYEMTEGTSPFARATPTAIISAIARHDPPPPTHASGKLQELIAALLQKDAADRPDARTALRMLTANSAAPTAASIPAPTPPTRREPAVTPATAPLPSPTPTRKRTLRIKEATELGLVLRIHVDGQVVGTVEPGLIEKVSLTEGTHEIQVSAVDGGQTSQLIVADPTDIRPLSFTVQRAASGDRSGHALRLDRDPDPDPVIDQALEALARGAKLSELAPAKKRFGPGKIALIVGGTVLGGLTIMGVVMAVGIAIFQRGISEAHAGDCVVKTKDGVWHKESCIQFFQPDATDSYKVVSRIDNTTDINQCPAQDPAWTGSYFGHSVAASGTRPAFVLCLHRV